MKFLGLISSVLFYLFAVQLQLGNGANYLFYIGMGSYSHRVPMQPLLDALAERGHKVTMLSGFPPKSPNPKITEFTPPKLLNWTSNLITDDFDVFKFRKNSQILQTWFILPILGGIACENLYTDEVFLKWMKDPATKFDVVVIDSLCNECAYGIAHHFNAKIVSFNTGQMYAWNPESNYGIPDESSSLPDGMMHFPTDMTFFQRAVTALVPLVWKAYREFYVFPKFEQITKDGLGVTEFPSFKDLEMNTSLTLINNHWAYEFPRSLPPNVVPVGGIAGGGKKGKPLPKKLDDFINKGKDGFIYVSFGTVAEFANFDPHVRNAFIQTLHKFPTIQFIWKAGKPLVEELPPNVMVEKWLPQTDLLVHPKLRLYVTHGGLGGIYEAIFSKVPMICFPIFAEQEFNADLMVQKGFAIKMELLTLTEEELTDGISKIIYNPSYKNQVGKVADLFVDRPMKPLDTAVWWMEFLLRHDSNEFLIPPSVRQSWWVRRQLDVWAFIFLVTLVLLSIPLLLIKLIFRLVCDSGSAQGSNKTKIKEKRS